MKKRFIAILTAVMMLMTCTAVCAETITQTAGTATVQGFGGEITVSLSPGKSNNALDYGIENGGRLLTDGGRLIACGGSVKAESPDEKSAQCSIFCNLEKAVEAPTEVVLRDENGEEVFSGTIPLSFTTMTISCPELTLQKPFILCIGEEQMEITPESTVTMIRPANF